MSAIWQVGAGDVGRDYSWLFLEHDLMFLGPGYAGAFESARYQAEVESGELTPFAAGMITAFCQQVQPGDIVLMRRGYRVVAVGLVPDEGYRHESDFNDIYGWNLEHTRRVLWQEHLTDDLAKAQGDRELFAGRKQIPTFTRVNDEAVVTPLRKLLERVRPRVPRARPASLPPPLTLDELGCELFNRGLGNRTVEQVQAAIERQRRLLAWYRRFGEIAGRPNEHEVVSHMILPLLLALGWSEQLLAVEWNKVDIAGFSGTPTTQSNCVMVCEAKKPRHGLQNVLDQPRYYVQSLALSACRNILLSQGGRFYLYRRQADGTWPPEPTGYLNVECIRTAHVAPANTDAVATLLALAPGGRAN